MQVNNKAEMPQAIKEKLSVARGIAMSNLKYQKAIDLYEGYYGKFAFDLNQKYRMAMLYDHRAMQVGEKAKEVFNSYLKKAENLYREIFKESPSYFHALYGIGRLYSARGDYKTALKFQIKAYKIMLKTPRKERGALAIGSLYESLENYKKAEEWYLREYRDTPKDDFGTVLNLFQFYKRQNNLKKALRYAIVLERLVKSEYKKKIYKGMKMNSSGFVKEIKKSIREIKKRAG
jgi:tetratricopeptide (TPR) repeat protein